MDIGYRISDKIQVYGNIGYTYRVPTYTDLYYIGPQAVGNENLQAEDALSEEVGFKFNFSNVNITLAGFNRDSNDLIDYVRINETDVVFTPRNIQDVNTMGFETQLDYRFKINNSPQKLHFGYTYIEDEVKNSGVAESRYSINSLKHQFVANYTIDWFQNFSATIAYRYTERTLGTSYNLYDANISYTYKNATFSMYANNIFNTEYFESNLPMPKGNVLFGLKYDFR